tara:strand:+ start:127 stop:516 length:390 start_codon:yes stop_codon:yes gene_type:complete
MRVKITKTVDMNDLAGETRRMLDQIKNKIMYGLPDQMSEIVKASLSNQGQEYFLTIDLIDNVRQQLADIDENLQEVHNIILGYRNALIPPEVSEDDQGRDEEWLANEEAEYEKFMSQVAGSEEGFDEEG